MARILGLDITESTVRGALVRTGLKRADVLRYIEVPIENGASGDDRTGATREAVRNVMFEIGRPPDRVIASLDGDEASVRVVTLPKAAAKRAAEVLPFELEAVLPFPIEEAIIDHQPIGTTENETRLLAAAVPRAKVAARLDELREVGVEPSELAVGAAALEGLVPLLPPLQAAGPVVLVDIEETRTDICILQNGRCEMARTLSIGLAHVRSGDRTSLETALRRTLVSYRASLGPSPTVAFVAGDAAGHANAQAWLAEILGTETHILPLPVAPGVSDEERPRLARATALGARAASRAKRMDLRQGDFASRRNLGRIRQHARLFAICAAAVLGSFIFSTYARWATLDDEREGLAAELESVSEELLGERTGDPVRARELLAGGQNLDDPLPSFDAFDVLSAISERVPQDIRHDTRRLNIELEDEKRDGRFELQGTVSSIAERDRIVTELSKHECFREIEPGRTTPGPGNQGLNYQLEAAVHCPGEARPGAPAAGATKTAGGEP